MLFWESVYALHAQLEQSKLAGLELLHVAPPHPVPTPGIFSQQFPVPPLFPLQQLSNEQPPNEVWAWD